MGIISRRLVTLDELARTSYVKEIIIKKYEPANLAFINLGGLKKGSNVPLCLDTKIGKKLSTSMAHLQLEFRLFTQVRSASYETNGYTITNTLIKTLLAETVLYGSMQKVLNGISL